MYPEATLQWHQREETWRRTGKVDGLVVNEWLRDLIIGIAFVGLHVHQIEHGGTLETPEPFGRSNHLISVRIPWILLKTPKLAPGCELTAFACLTSLVAKVWKRCPWISDLHRLHVRQTPQDQIILEFPYAVLLCAMTPDEQREILVSALLPQLYELGTVMNEWIFAER